MCIRALSYLGKICMSVGIQKIEESRVWRVECLGAERLVLLYGSCQ